MRHVIEAWALGAWRNYSILVWDKEDVIDFVSDFLFTFLEIQTMYKFEFKSIMFVPYFCYGSVYLP